jgi:hypothetical protein
MHAEDAVRVVVAAREQAPQVPVGGKERVAGGARGHASAQMRAYARIQQSSRHFNCWD